MNLAVPARRETLHIGISRRDRRDFTGHQPIDAAQHGILLMHDRRDALGKCAKQGRQSRIAAKADDTARLEGFIELPRHAAAFHDRLEAANPTPDAAGHAACREDMRLHIVEQTGDLRTTLVGHQSDAMSARHQFLRNRMGRNHMSARAAGSQHIVPENAHRPLHFIILEERDIYGLRRVNASSRPMPPHKAIIDEPP